MRLRALSIWLVLLVLPPGCGRPSVDDMHNARNLWIAGCFNLGSAYLDRKAEGKVDFSLEGARFWAQFAGEMSPRMLAGPCDRCCTTVTLDGRAIKVGYLGPDREALERMARGDTKGLGFIACSRNVLDSACALCVTGVAAIDENGMGEYLFLDDLEFKEDQFEPIPIGPGCPDPRFRHLVE